MPMVSSVHLRMHRRVRSPFLPAASSEPERVNGVSIQRVMPNTCSYQCAALSMLRTMHVVRLITSAMHNSRFGQVNQVRPSRCKICTSQRRHATWISNSATMTQIDSGTAMAWRMSTTASSRNGTERGGYRAAQGFEMGRVCRWAVRLAQGQSGRRMNLPRALPTTAPSA